MKIAVLGPNGMLGKAVVSEAESRGLDYEAIDVIDPSSEFWWPHKTKEFGLVVNCVGAIPIKKYLPYQVVEANSNIPLSLGEHCQEFNLDLIHVSTDCVFSGSRPVYPYRKTDIPDATDLYGRSKALGELCSDYGAMVVRTSFIGFEHGLLDWLLQQKGEIEGWERAYWTGSTVYEVAKRLLDLQFKSGVYHLSTSLCYTKYGVLKVLKEAFNVDVSIKRTREPSINRALAPDYEISGLYDTGVMDNLLKHFRG